MLSKEEKSTIINKFGRSSSDTGSSKVQVALLTARINQVAEHLKKFSKDKHSRRGLMQLLGQRKSFLKYVQRKDFANYDEISKIIKQKVN